MNIVKWLDQEIINLSGYIIRHQSVGAYQDNCQRWALYIDAYRKLLIVIEEDAKQNVSLDNQPNGATQNGQDCAISRNQTMTIAPFPTLPAKEQLHSGLRRYVRRGSLGTKVLQHPLVVQTYSKQHNAIYNRLYQDKLKELEAAKASQNWAKMIWLHERMFRATALQKIARAMPDDQYWRLLAEVWIDAENVFQMQSTWLKLWSAPRPRRELVMTDSEHDALAILPEVTPGMVAIYRGCRDPAAARGLSWAVSRTQALWFAHRFASPQHMPLLATAVVGKRDIQAYFLDRRDDEAEIVALPQDCQSLEIEPLTLRQRVAV